MLAKQLFIVFILSNLIACASGPGRAAEGDLLAESGGSDCIFEGTIRDYRVLDDANLIVVASAKRKYHIELSRRAIGLQSSWQLGFRSSSSRICPGSSEVVVSDSATADRVRISRIWALSPSDFDNLLIRFGEKEPDPPKPLQPGELPGAEVEELD